MRRASATLSAAASTYTAKNHTYIHGLSIDKRGALQNSILSLDTVGACELSAPSRKSSVEARVGEGTGMIICEFASS